MDPRRIDYTGDGISEDQLLATPYAQVRAWVDDAVARAESRPDVVEPLAAAVATVDADGRPNVRTVLLRFLDERGPGFVTDLSSTKGTSSPATRTSRSGSPGRRCTARSGSAAGRSSSTATRCSPTGPRGRGPPASRPGPRTSPSPSARGPSSRRRYRRAAEEFPDHGSPDDVPVPDAWGGYRIVCDEVEFWGGRRNRLHDRLVFTRTGEGDLGDAGSWEVSRRQP